MAKPSDTAKETIEYDGKFLKTWNEFCDQKGYVKRQASHACRVAFMNMTADAREAVMAACMAEIGKTGKTRR